MASFILCCWLKRKQKAENSTVQGNDLKRARAEAAILMSVDYDKCCSVFKLAWINKFSWLKYDSAAETEDVFVHCGIDTSQTCAPSVFVHNFYHLLHGNYNHIAPGTNLHTLMSQFFSSS